jgi:hypothetical protein
MSAFSTFPMLYFKFKTSVRNSISLSDYPFTQSAYTKSTQDISSQRRQISVGWVGYDPQILDWDRGVLNVTSLSPSKRPNAQSAFPLNRKAYPIHALTHRNDRIIELSPNLDMYVLQIYICPLHVQMFKNVSIVLQANNLEQICLPRQRRPPARLTGNAVAFVTSSAMNHY